MSKNTIFKSIVVFFVALLSMSTPCHACWDEYDDDYYDYDSYDDWDYWDDWEAWYNWDDEYYSYDGNTWLDDIFCDADRIDNDDSYSNDNCDDWNNSDSNNDDDDNNNNYSYDESNETEYESGDNFDNSDLIGVYDHDDDFPDDGYDNYNDDGYDYHYDDDNANDNIEYDHSEDIHKIEIRPEYIYQPCKFCCVPAVMAIMNMVFNPNMTIEDAYKKEQEYENIYYNLTNEYFENGGIESNKIRDFFRFCGFDTSACAINSISECTDRGCQVFVFIDVTDEEGKQYGHALDIIDSYKGENGEMFHTCINPATGKAEEHSASEFKHPKEVFCVRGIK